jgi:hypothetical protein
MNNKSDKKHKPKPIPKLIPKPKTKNKKKTTSHQSKNKMEIKRGGVWPSLNNSANTAPRVSPNLQQSVSSSAPVNSQTQLANLRNSQQNVSQTPAPVNSKTLSQNVSQTQLANSRNPQLNVSQAQPPQPPPNANPQGLNTIKSTSRCSIL